MVMAQRAGANPATQKKVRFPLGGERDASMVMAQRAGAKQNRPSIITSFAPGNKYRNVQFIRVFAHYLHLLSQHYVEHRDIAFYAFRLCITTTYLSRIVRQVSLVSVNCKRPSSSRQPRGLKCEECQTNAKEVTPNHFLILLNVLIFSNMEAAHCGGAGFW